MRPTTTKAGKLNKIHCEECGQVAYQTIANLRDFRRPECCGRVMTVDNPDVFAITPEGIEAECARYDSTMAKREARKVEGLRRERWRQLQCRLCGTPQTRETSEAIWQAFEATGKPFDGVEIMLGVDRLSNVGGECVCGKCGGDRFEPMRKRGKTQRQEARDAIPF